MTLREANSWTQIREELLRRIHDRTWKPGDLIPGEAELAEEFGCARTTVNRALRDLAETGLVTRRRKAGTRIAVNPPHKATLTIPIVREEVEARGATYRHAVLERDMRKLPPHLGGAFHLPDGADVLFMRSMHYADDQPFIYEERYTNIAAVPEMAETDFKDISANEWLVQTAPYTGGDMVFFAANADETLSAHFGAPVGTALFVVERTTWNGDEPITHVRMTYAPGYRMRTSL
ncbi:GntR family transcriptional regulator [Roseibium aggregatum]|uniref:UTRA domain-containing protein n=1 Tax=Roseibium aggregatum TaxID=187304 RepID=A0A926S6X0_9HYPH|nr:GntR family transcriptional regulator [Roseibium aggregatum]MBD1549008.1 UTRA domain-containing protein [Roseibium aggregatum]